MSTSSNYSQRIQVVASTRGLSFDELESKVDINRNRLSNLWNGKASPEASEVTKLAKAMSVDEAILQNNGAKKLWVRLVERLEEWRFPELWPKLANLTGLRGASDLIEVPDDLIDQLIEGNPTPRYGLQFVLLPVDSATD